MSAFTEGQATASNRLLPHQAAFVEAVTNPEAPRLFFLRADVGLGKSFAIVATVGRVLENHPNARILLLVPASLGRQFFETLQDAGSPAILVDRFFFRQLLDSQAIGEIWPRGVAAILSQDFAKQADVRDSLAACDWDLVVVDEAHRVSGSRATALEAISHRVRRIVLISAIKPEPKSFIGAMLAEALVVEWRRENLVDHDGARLDSLPRPILHEVPIRLSRAEHVLWEATFDLTSEIIDHGRGGALLGHLLTRGLHSGPAVLERLLRRILEGPRDSLGALLELMDDEDGAGETGEWTPTDPGSDQAKTLAETALQVLEGLTEDSKLSTCMRVLKQIDALRGAEAQIVVVTDFVSTLFYLAAEIEGGGELPLLLHGGMSYEERFGTLNEFKSKRVLIATRAMMTSGIAFQDVTDVVLYDLPESRIVAEQVLGRFDRFGRSKQLHIHALHVSGTAEPSAAGPIALLRDLMGGPDAAHPAP